MLKRRWRWLAAFLVLAVLAPIVLASCQSPVPRRDPTGEMFPAVMGESLAGESIALPGSLAGSPALLLVGYKQNSQFDIDRWLLGVHQAGLKVQLLEVPTLPGLAARMASGFIDNGMRSGIPKEDWSSVVCVYGDAKKIVEFTGNENPMPGRLVLLDGDGRVVFFHDRGYSVGTLQKVQEKLEALGG